MHINKALAAIFLGLACSCYALPPKPNAVDAIYSAEPRSDTNTTSDIPTNEGRLAPLELDARQINGKADNNMVGGLAGDNEESIGL